MQTFRKIGAPPHGAFPTISRSDLPTRRARARVRPDRPTAVPAAAFVRRVLHRAGAVSDGVQWRGASAVVALPVVSSSIGDDVGIEHAYRLSDGASVLRHNAAGAIYTSAAVAFGRVVFGTTSGYLDALG